MLKYLFSFLLMLFFLNEASAKIYQWKDENGKTHYSDKKPTNAQNKKLNIRSLDNIRFSNSSKDVGEQVIIYSTVWCRHCKKAKRYFRNNNIPFVEYDIEKDTAARQRYDQLQGRGVPLILVGKNRMSGFSEKGFEKIYK